jgi:hypothetical protein
MDIDEENKRISNSLEKSRWWVRYCVANGLSLSASAPRKCKGARRTERAVQGEPLTTQTSVKELIRATQGQAAAKKSEEEVERVRRITVLAPDESAKPSPSGGFDGWEGVNSERERGRRCTAVGIQAQSQHTNQR